MTAIDAAAFDAEAWQRSFDVQQESYLPDREERFTAMIDVVVAVAGESPRVLDLAGGTGSISLRLAARLPRARSVVLDVDPALLAIASATVAVRGLGDRVSVVTADLATPAWADAIEAPFDAVLTATALHWLETDRFGRLLGEVREVLRDGGVYLDADHIPDDGLPSLHEPLRALDRARRDAVHASGDAYSWEGWWERARADAALAPLVAERDARFGGDHADGSLPELAWHLGALRAAGFRETGVVWRGGTDAVVAGLR